MLRQVIRPALVAVVAAAVAAVGAGSAGGTQVAAGTDRYAGPPYDFTTALMDGRQVGKPLTNVAMITRSEHGYVFHAGSQDNHLVVTQVERGLRFADTATPRFKSLVPACRQQKVKVGVAAVCRMPDGVSTATPLLVEVWPRIGDDFVDGSTLPATIAMTFLGDLGDDVARLGAGPDFFNGAFGRDRVTGGAGDDWLRGGDDRDVMRGGRGNDDLVGIGGPDVIYGGDGDDRLVGMDGNDRIFAGPGRDFVLCGNGVDTARVDGDDSLRTCEQVRSR